MPRQLDPRIAEILRNYGEDPTDSKGVIWDCHGTWVVYHKALERVAARAGISFDKPDVLRAQRDEAVIMVTGRMADRTDWDIGEALIGVNYRVSGKQAAYVYAMALKRGRDRLILKLVGLHGLLYSEEEADEFKPAPATTEAANETSRTAPRETTRAVSRALMDVLREVEQCESANDLTALWRTSEMKDMLASLEQAEYGVARAAFEKKGNALKAAA